MLRRTEKYSSLDADDACMKSRSRESKAILAYSFLLERYRINGSARLSPILVARMKAVTLSSNWSCRECSPRRTSMKSTALAGPGLLSLTQIANL